MDLKILFYNKSIIIDVGYEYMKKVKLLCLTILGLLFLIPFVNYSTAAPEDYLGVVEGDSYSWKLYMNANALVELVEDNGGTLDLAELEDILFLGEIGSLTFIAKVIDILPEDTMMLNGTLVTYVPVNTTLSASVPGLGTEEIGTMIVPVFSNETAYYLHMMYYYFEMGPAFMFVAYNLNWTKIVEDINELYGISPIFTNVTVTEESNGIKLVVPEGEFNATQEEMEFKLTYTDNGVLSYAGLKYGGVTVVALTLGGDGGEIPGYTLPIIVGTFAVVGIGLVYFIKKKHRI
jgi:hypothetical protein